jgi:hypothetical protein
VLFRSLFTINKTNKKGQLTHQDIADNALQAVKFDHYNGKLTLPLYPEVDLYAGVHYTDIRFPERSGIYTVRAVDTELSQKGFHREISIAYLKSIDEFNSKGLND